MESMTFLSRIFAFPPLAFHPSLWYDKDRSRAQAQGACPMGRSGCRNAAFCLILQLALANKMTKMQGLLCAKRTGGPVQKFPRR